MTWLLSAAAREVMLAHAAEAHPNEACGLLLGAGRRVREARPAANLAPTPASHFEIDPAALFAAQRAERAEGPALLGYYHSHPNGAAEPSAIDQASAAADGRLWLILARGSIRGYVADGANQRSRLRAARLEIGE